MRVWVPSGEKLESRQVLLETGGATRRVPKRVAETVARCKVTATWKTYWLSDITSSCDGKLGGGVTYELRYRSREGQDWVTIPTKTPTKIISGLLPSHTYDFQARAGNAAGWGEYSPTCVLVTPGEKKVVGGGGAGPVAREDEQESGEGGVNGSREEGGRG
ncbi:unnamed protein product [Discosporangium mesarthrocarpum]